MRRWFQKYKRFIPNTTIGRIAIGVIICWIFFAIFSPFIANNKPIIANGPNGWTMPIFNNVEVEDLENYTFSINPIM